MAGCKRTTDLASILAATDPYKEGLYGFDPSVWSEDERNIALINEFGDLNLFEYEKPGVVTGHYFYTSRGRAAINAGKAALHELFTGPYGVQVMRGLTPLEKLGARWLNRQLSIKSYGVVITVVGPCELVIITKQEWEQSQ